jgi:hypothetical protein
MIGGLRSNPAFSRVRTTISPDALIPVLRERYAALRSGSHSTPGSSPVVSVVIPIYFKETGDQILASIDSLCRNKKTPPTEVVLVINGNTPTADIILSESYRTAQKIGVRVLTLSYAEDNRYRNVEWPQNIFSAKQYGFEAAEGIYVLSADIDNSFSEGWIRAYAEAFEQDPELIAAYGPVHLYGAVSTVGRLMMFISTLAKAAKILIDFPPFAGHNHAMRKDLSIRVPRVYEQIVMDCHEIPGLLTRDLGLTSPLTRCVRCIPGAVAATYFPEHTASAIKAFRWIFKAIRRNLSNLRRVRKNATPSK